MADRECDILDVHQSVVIGRDTSEDAGIRVRAFLDWDASILHGSVSSLQQLSGLRVHRCGLRGLDVEERSIKGRKVLGKEVAMLDWQTVQPVGVGMVECFGVETIFWCWRYSATGVADHIPEAVRRGCIAAEAEGKANDCHGLSIRWPWVHWSVVVHVCKYALVVPRERAGHRAAEMCKDGTRSVLIARDLTASPTASRAPSAIDSPKVYEATMALDMTQLVHGYLGAGLSPDLQTVAT